MAGNRATLFHQAKDTIRTDIISWLDDVSIFNLAVTNSRLYGLLLPIILARLQTYIVQRNLDGVAALLDQDPSLLLKTSSNKITTVAGCEYVNRTPLQVARGEGDANMCDLLLTYFFDSIPNGRDEAAKQLEKFTDTLNDVNHTYDFSDLVDAITHNKNVDAALEKFRSDLDAIVKTKGFPFQALLDSGKAYDANFSVWSVNQLQQFSVFVIGYLQRLSPSWLRQIYAEGLEMVVNYNLSCKNYRVREGLDIDPANDVPGKGLGYDYCVNIVGVDNKKEIDFNWRSEEMITFAGLTEKLYAREARVLLDLLVDQRFGWEDLMHCL